MIRLITNIFLNSIENKNIISIIHIYFPNLQKQLRHHYHLQNYIEIGSHKNFMLKIYTKNKNFYFPNKFFVYNMIDSINNKNLIKNFYKKYVDQTKTFNKIGLKKFYNIYLNLAEIKDNKYTLNLS